MLELQHISFSVDVDGKQKDILRDINLVIDDQFVAVTGPNGSGKSTLAKLIMGIEKPTQGRILLNGEDITDLAVDERARRGISFAFQQPVRFKGLDIFQLVSLAAGRELSKDTACEYLSEVGLCALDYVDRPLDQSLSGGELKRIEIAMMLARGSEFTILDEPEAGIDLWSFQNLISVFHHLHEVTGGTILIISHQERILNMVDKIIVLEEGRVAQYGIKDDILPGLILEVDDCKRACDHFSLKGAAK
ncbi:MAG: ATP-binding cassette domain-containing protein [Clostridiales bacterium]|jgi:Fe-S cluster assembly ATP-binding protein|nr:ATP-binding cassette domain-containing protein [Clostridiales bacterium]MDD2571959.1 ATP-binding cassette domain-containing protein [Eubacteriales bacterium]MDY0120049.1 ATP-binding cassette domain-containing protein [Clostridia bacterium]NLG30344.1 ATP-binding cassette domain-containing protein [Clostridiaceae bacterium]MCK9350731.1 ATP-binding cassette domain-containing protein [Clostridiales bacterium]